MRKQHLFLVIGYAVLVALLAMATAEALPGKNTVDSGDIKNGQVKREDLGKNAVVGSKVAANSLTGADVNERTLSARAMGCQAGMIKGYASIDGSPPPTPSSDPAHIHHTFSCAGRAPLVSYSNGAYTVRFPGTQLAGAQVTTANFNWSKWGAAYSQPAPDTFEVIMATQGSGGPLTTQAGFYILVY